MIGQRRGGFHAPACHANGHIGRSFAVTISTRWEVIIVPEQMGQEGCLRAQLTTLIGSQLTGFQESSHFAHCLSGVVGKGIDCRCARRVGG